MTGRLKRITVLTLAAVALISVFASNPASAQSLAQGETLAIPLASSEQNVSDKLAVQQPIIVAGQLKSGPSSPSPTGGGKLKTKPRRVRGTCTSSNGQHTCYCGEKGCVGLESSCYCIEFSAPTKPNPTD
jgi:hypothetical protein